MEDVDDACSCVSTSGAEAWLEPITVADSLEDSKESGEDSPDGTEPGPLDKDGTLSTLEVVQALLRIWSTGFMGNVEELEASVVGLVTCAGRSKKRSARVAQWKMPVLRYGLLLLF